MGVHVVCPKTVLLSALFIRVLGTSLAKRVLPGQLSETPATGDRRVQCPWLPAPTAPDGGWKPQGWALLLALPAEGLGIQPPESLGSPQVHLGGCAQGRERAGKRLPRGHPPNSPPDGRGSGSCSAHHGVEGTQMGQGIHPPLTVSFSL